MIFNLAPTYANPVKVQLPPINNFGNIEFGRRTTVTSGIRFGNDGKIYRQTSAGAWQWTGKVWLLDGSAASYYIVREVTAGYPNTTLTTDDGTLQQMNTNLDYTTAVSSAGIEYNKTINFSIADDSLGSNILVSQTYQLSAEKIAGRFDRDRGGDFFIP